MAAKVALPQASCKRRVRVTSLKREFFLGSQFFPSHIPAAEFMDVKLPNLGEGADSGTVVGILVKPGAQIKKGQSIIELETGKAVAPIPSPAAGTVTNVRVKEGDK